MFLIKIAFSRVPEGVSGSPPPSKPRKLRGFWTPAAHDLVKSRDFWIPAAHDLVICLVWGTAGLGSHKTGPGSHKMGLDLRKIGLGSQKMEWGSYASGMGSHKSTWEIPQQAA